MASKGFKAMAERTVHAEERFLDILMGLGDLSRADAERVLVHYRKIRAVKMDAVNGRLDVTHGALLDPDVIRRALAA